ncbi:MAG: hypothetical protein JWO81_1127 [Alphaproteobacteria bacterium]|nr:hypothetical protein [Alphaproteobacteria bacterium]
MGVRFLVAAMLLLTAAAPAVNPVGRYRLHDGPDVASELELRADGRFGYALAAGSLDEAATGRWRRIGNRVLLTTVPKPVPPVFSPGKAGRTTEAPLTLHVTWPNGRGIPGVDFRVEFESGDPFADYINNDEGWSLAAAETRKPVAVTLALPGYGLVSPRFAIDPAKANDLTFVLTPHDMGRVDFQDLPLDIAPGRLVMHRGGATENYQRER